MAKSQFQSILECNLISCRHVHECKIHWGKRCNRQGGRKIPRFRVRPYYDTVVSASADINGDIISTYSNIRW